LIVIINGKLFLFYYLSFGIMNSVQETKKGIQMGILDKIKKNLAGYLEKNFLK